MTILGEPVIGLEQIQRATILHLMDHVNPALAQVEAWMAPSDEAMADRLGIPYVATELEPIDPGNFIEGHRPSLIDSPVEKYPNCAAWAVRAAPIAESDSFDQLGINAITVYIETMVKSILSEEEVNRRAQRTAEAVNIAVMQDRTLGGVVTGLETDPVLDLSDVFTRKERTSYGPHWFWQGARLEYTVRKETVYPSSSTGSFFRTGQFDIDQG